MAEGLDSITVDSPIGAGQRIASSLVGMLVGVVLFFASFVVLWWNEGNVIAEKNALEEMRSALVEGNAAKPNPAHNGKLIHTTGKLVSKEQVGDAPYLKPGPYLRLDRVVEMFQWVEEEHTSGSGKNRKTTYTYERKWATGREKSESFHLSSGHANPPLSINQDVHAVKQSTFGALNGQPLVERLEADTHLPLTAAMLAQAGKTAPELKSDYLMIAKKRGSASPEIGDVRISYKVLKPGTFSVIAKQTGRTLAEHHAKNGKEKFLIATGTKPAAAMIETAKNDANFMAMILRVVGFFMMFFGLNFLAGPITTLLDFLPIVGTASRFLLGIVFFVASAILSTVTIVISMIAHNPILLTLFVALAVVGGVIAWQKKKARAAQSFGMPQGMHGGAPQGMPRGMPMSGAPKSQGSRKIA